MSGVVNVPRLRLVFGGVESAVYPLELPATEWSFGRSRQCTYQLADDGISRSHFQIRCDGTDYHVADLGSRNGTSLNGQLLTRSARLRDGDRLGVCGLELIFELPRSITAWVDAPLDPSTVRHDLADEPSRSHLLQSVDPQARLDAVLAIGESLRSAVDLDAVLQRVLEQLLAIFPQADRGLVVLREPPSGEPVLRAWHARIAAERPPSLSRTILREVVERGTAVLSRDVLTDERYAAQHSVIAQSRTVICVPLFGQDRQVLGAIQLDGQRTATPFREEDLALLAAIAPTPAIAVENARLHRSALERARLQRDLEIAQRVQESLLPAHSPEVAGYRFAARYEAAGGVGGDVYDYVPLPDGKLAVLIGDVAGKGVPAALAMARLSAEARFLLAATARLGEAVAQLSERLAQLLPEAHYVTFVVVVLDPLEHQLTIVNAGHLPPVHFGVGTAPHEVGAAESGFPLALIPGARYVETSCTLGPGQGVVLFTDGVTEAMNRAEEFFGPRDSDRLACAIEPAGGSPDEVVERLLAAVRTWRDGAPPSDDLCIVALARD